MAMTMVMLLPAHVCWQVELTQKEGLCTVYAPRSLLGILGVTLA
jgi:hypothetical protein